jgi:hypothetical protein
MFLPPSEEIKLKVSMTTVECVERGELLSDVRNRLKDLLNNVPKQIMR